MPDIPNRLTELEETIAVTEENIALRTWVIERRVVAGQDATRLKKLVRLTQTRLAKLIARRTEFLKNEEPD